MSGAFPAAGRLDLITAGQQDDSYIDDASIDNLTIMVELMPRLLDSKRRENHSPLSHQDPWNDAQGSAGPVS